MARERIGGWAWALTVATVAALVLPAATAAAQDADPQACSGDNPPAPFADREQIRAVHRANVDCAYNAGLAGGFADGTYRPDRGVRRDQMAAFVARTLDVAGAELPAAADQGFTDIEGNTHADDINRLAAAEVVEGTTPTTFSPAALVRRDQIASFVLRAVAYADGRDLAELQSAQDRFADVAPGNVHRPNVNGAARLGLAHGRTATTYDPGGSTRRDQMASFLVRALSYLRGADLTALSLRGDGLGAGLLVGTPMGAALEQLTDRLGPADDDSGWLVYCEFAGPEQARTFTWADNLRVTFLDRTDPRVETYGYARAADGSDPLGLATPVGVDLDSVSADVAERYGPRATFHSSDTNPFGSFYEVEPAEGGSQVVFVADDTPSAPVEFIGANVLFCD